MRGGAYQIHASAPVAAYQFNPLTYERMGATRRYQSYTNDASLLISQRALTQRYLAVTMPHWRVAVSPVDTTVLGGFLAVTAVAGETTSVTVRLPRGHGVSDATGDMVRHDNLMPGDVALIVGDNDGDLSGAVIEASAPVAVFAGHDCTQVPQGRPACDHLEEQLFPMEALGRDYVVSALRDRDYPHVTRVVAAFDNTLVTLDPATLAPPVRLAAGEVLQIITDQSFRVTASRPIEVAQFMVGQGDSREVGGDPAMVLEVPTQQYRARYDFLVPDTYEHNFVDLIVPTGAHVLLDGMPYLGTPRALGPWSLVHGDIGAGAHRLSTMEGVPLGIKVSGTARYTSYMYPGGLDLQLLPPG